MARKERRKRNPGWFKQGEDPRRHTGFSIEACRKGYRSAMSGAGKCSDPNVAAWLFRKVRSLYRRKRRDEKEEG